jgi:hypothetical protein
MRLCTFSFVPIRTADELIYDTINAVIIVTVITVSITQTVSLAYREWKVGSEERKELMVA